MRGKLVLTVVAATLFALSASAGAGDVVIVNPGFEAQNFPDGEYNWMYDDEGWGYFNNDGYMGAWNPGRRGASTYPGYGGDAPEGSNVGWTEPGQPNGGDGGFAQVLAETLAVDTTYTLTVEVGNNLDYAWTGYKVQLLVGGTPHVAGDGTIYTWGVTEGTVLAEDNSSLTPGDGIFLTSTIRYIYDGSPTDANFVGQHLQIRLLAVPGSGEVDFDDVKLFADSMNPSPANGETVYGSETLLLSWTNLPATTSEPNTDPVWVDVWFGTDPNAWEGPQADPTLDKELNATSALVSAPVAGAPPTVYYWRVDSYVGGGGGGDKAVEGPLYTFYVVNDFPPVSVFAGPDMITWSDRGVVLGATVVDDDRSPLTYEWSADDPTAVFDPNAYVDDPTVTITKTPGEAVVSIVNYGFEDPPLSDANDTTKPTGWADGYYYDLTNTRTWRIITAGAGGYNPSAAQGYGGVAPEGENVAYTTSYTNLESGMFQVLSSTLQADTQYELSALVGNPVLLNVGLTADYRIELLAGGVVIASDANSSPTDDTYWNTARCTFEPVASHPQLGQALEIRLLALGNVPGKEVDFDDVMLTLDGSGSATVTLTLEVIDGVSSTKDTMKINVYDTDCLAARYGFGLSADNPGDIDGDCDTDIKDLAEVLETWLDDHSLTGPVPKPVPDPE